MKYYTLIFRWACCSQVEVYDDATKFGHRLGDLYFMFDAPSTIGTWSTWARDKDEAIEKAKKHFANDGWAL
jgi:hypothetical protein